MATWLLLVGCGAFGLVALAFVLFLLARPGGDGPPDDDS
jgi:hypothetical protein